MTDMDDQVLGAQLFRPLKIRDDGFDRAGIKFRPGTGEIGQIRQVEENGEKRGGFNR